MKKTRKKMVRFVMRNKIIKKIGLDTDNSFSWIKNEKETWGFRPAIARKENVLHSNYIVFSELMHLLRKENPDLELNKKQLFRFLRKNKINLLKKRDVDEVKVHETLEFLKKERGKNKWPSGDSDLKIISIYHVAGIDCISTNNLKDFEGPCKLLNIDLDIPTIIEPGSRQDVNKMLRNLYGNKSFRKKKR